MRYIRGMYELAQAPIAPGTQRTARLAGGGCIEMQDEIAIGGGAATILIDVQLETYGRHPVVRVAGDGRLIGFDLDRRFEGITAHLWHTSGSGSYYGHGPLSQTTGKRLALRFTEDGRSALIDEFQPWGPRVRQEVAMGVGIPLQRDWAGARVGGPSAEVPGSSYCGRAAEFCILDTWIGDETIEAYRAASLPPEASNIPTFRPGALDDDGCNLLLDGYGQLIRWHNAGGLDRRGLREASSIASIWMLDGYTLLQRASDHFGAMLWFPDLRRGPSLEAILEEHARALWRPDSEHSGDWVPLSAFRDDLACWLGESETKVTWVAFIKFVRNKLGGAHYDPDDRAAWQRQLAELARQEAVGGEAWLAETMMTLVRALIIAADGSGIVTLVREEQARALS